MSKVIRDRQFGEERVPADNTDFINCRFDGTTLVYRGGVPFTLEGETGTLQIAFEGAAENTINVLRGLFAFGYAPMVEQIIESLRNPFGDTIQ